MKVMHTAIADTMTKRRKRQTSCSEHNPGWEVQRWHFIYTAAEHIHE